MFAFASNQPEGRKYFAGGGSPRLSPANPKSPEGAKEASQLRHFRPSGFPDKEGRLAGADAPGKALSPFGLGPEPCQRTKKSLACRVGIQVTDGTGKKSRAARRAPNSVAVLQLHFVRRGIAGVENG